MIIYHIGAEVETRRELLYSEVEEFFRDHEGRNHLVLDKQIFINATDKHDPEIEVLKQTITQLAFEHPCWGEQMPNASVSLELEIAELVAEGKQILSLKEIEELNAISKVTSAGLIVPDIVTGVKECLVMTMERISEFYQSTIQGKNGHQSPFHMEYSCSQLKCFISEEEALKTNEWVCDKHNLTHRTGNWVVWNQDKKNEQCEENCPGLSDDALN
ncbi:unnamed protein product [Mytilus coruscus]|uniref:Uncharacterized protein n=1 Tax=Mytilus coruscus TaxID=42192 RepID=A0A6J8BG08_MYTCO|nr:unnamed protein product [Mytilus coruscus]